MLRLTDVTPGLNRGTWRSGGSLLRWRTLHKSQNGAHLVMQGWHGPLPYLVLGQDLGLLLVFGEPGDLISMADTDNLRVQGLAKLRDPFDTKRYFSIVSREIPVRWEI